ncbi:MAG TPA: hypothetical protein VL200_00940 [Lacunisphaera sp.]|jgi:hypothetical protein|nr:hypothetical protein [Lacunisphaera sp.]
MKQILLLSIIVVVAGCQSAPPPSLPVPTPPAAPPALPAAAPTTNPNDADRKFLRQRQVIEALISQNDALTAELAAFKTAHGQNPSFASPEPFSAPKGPPIAPRPEAPMPPSDPLPLLTANADGMIDAVAALAPAAGAPVNPFAIRSGTTGGREVSLTLQGIVGGAQPCALINGRPLRAGDTVEALRFDRVEGEAVLLRGDGFRLKLIPAEKPVRVRLP